MSSQSRGFSTIRARLDFKNAFEHGRRFFRGGLGFCALKTPNGGFKFAVSVSKRFGKAVYRNKLRRRVKEIIRTSAFLPSAAMVVISAKKPCEGYSFASLKNACEWAFDKIEKMPVEAVRA